MPIRAFFEPRRIPLTPVAIPGGLAGNGTGITVTGPVLEGRMSVDEALVLSWIRGQPSPQPRTLIGSSYLTSPRKPPR